MVAAPGGEDVMRHCGGLRAVLAAVGFDFRLALPSPLQDHEQQPAPQSEAQPGDQAAPGEASAGGQQAAMQPAVAAEADSAAAAATPAQETTAVDDAAGSVAADGGSVAEAHRPAAGSGAAKQVDAGVPPAAAGASSGASGSQGQALAAQQAVLNDAAAAGGTGMEDCLCFQLPDYERVGCGLWKSPDASLGLVNVGTVHSQWPGPRYVAKILLAVPNTWLCIAQLSASQCLCRCGRRCSGACSGGSTCWATAGHWFPMSRWPPTGSL